MVHKRSRYASERRKQRRPQLGKTKNSSGPSVVPPPPSLDVFLDSVNRVNRFGDDPGERVPQSTRLVFRNVDGVQSSRSSQKMTKLTEWWKKEKVDIALLSEMNCDWRFVDDEDQWSQRLRSVCRDGFSTVTAFNRQDSKIVGSSFQHGGTSVSVLSLLSHRSGQRGQDPWGLGRWSWIRIQGKDRTKSMVDVDDNEDGEEAHIPSLSQDLIVVSAYRPNPPGMGVNTVWAQHRDHFLKLHRFEDPRELFWADLRVALEEWREQGAEVIVGIDANEDLALGPGSFFAQLNMREVLLERHSLQDTQSTYFRNFRNRPIDGIFATPGVDIMAGGYYDFDEHFTGTHRGLWVDFCILPILGITRNTTTRFQVRKLVNDTPSVVRRYVRSVETEYRRLRIPQRLARLAEDVEVQHGVLTARQLKRFDSLHRQAYEARRLAESKCRKLRMGKVPWSPSTQKIWDRLELWKMLAKTHCWK